MCVAAGGGGGGMEWNGQVLLPRIVNGKAILASRQVGEDSESGDLEKWSALVLHAEQNDRSTMANSIAKATFVSAA